MPRKTIPVACFRCGKITQKAPDRHKYAKHLHCSRECAKATRAIPITEVPCANCGAVIRKKFKGKHARRFCRLSCQRDWQQTHPYESGVKRPSLVKLTCVQCRRPFVTTASLARSGAMLCSNRCKFRRKSALRGPVVVACASCGKSFDCLRWKVENTQRQFCSRRCMGDWRTANLVGEASATWKGGRLPYYGPNWHEEKRAARQRDGHRCRHCQITEKELHRTLDVHHITPFRTFGYIVGVNTHYLQANDLSNLISLCHRHHIWAEHGKIDVLALLLAG